MAGLRELEVKHLVALDAVAHEGTFARAAARLGYTQSAISQQIAALERIVGDPVFDRPGGPRPVVLTPLGERLLLHGRDLLSRIEAAAADLDRFRRGDVGSLAVGAYQSVCSALLPVVVARLYADHPDLELRVEERDDDEELLVQLADGALDLTFTVTTTAPGNEVRRLLDDPFVLVARPGQFPAGPVAVTALAGLPMIGQHPHACQVLNERGLRAGGLDPNYVFRTDDNGTVAAMVRAGMGVAVMPLLCVDLEDTRVTLHRLEPALPPRPVNLAWPLGRTLSAAAQRFIDLATEECAALVRRSVPFSG